MRWHFPFLVERPSISLILDSSSKMEILSASRFLFLTYIGRTIVSSSTGVTDSSAFSTSSSQTFSETLFIFIFESLVFRQSSASLLFTSLLTWSSASGILLAKSSWMFSASGGWQSLEGQWCPQGVGKEMWMAEPRRTLQGEGDVRGRPGSEF